MNVLALDNFVDTAGTLATAHTPLIGGSISAQSGGQGTITVGNRLRGQSQGYLVYANLPASGNYTIEADIYVASNANGVGITMGGSTGALFSYSLSNGYWNLAGLGMPSGQHYSQSVNAGETHKIKLVSAGSVITAYVDGVQAAQKTATQTITAGPAGIFFLGTDTDGTGYQVESFTVYESPASSVDLDGTFLVDGGSLLNLNSDNELYLLGLTDLLTGSYVTTATVSATVKTLSGTTIGTVTLSYVSGSLTVSQPNGLTQTSAGGNYRGQLPYSTSLTEGAVYNIVVTATSGSNQRQWRGAYAAGLTTK